MSKPIEDYGFIGNMISCALVARDGSIDWLCLPRFDSDACFAALLGTPDHGRWLIAPRDGDARISRRYLPNTAILETTYETNGGRASVTDFMPLCSDGHTVELIRIVRGLSGSVDFDMDLALRFGYGRTVPWVRRRDYGLRAVAGPDTIDVVTPIPLRGHNMKTTAAFTVREGEAVPFTLAHHPSLSEPRFIDDRRLLLERTATWWREWAANCALPQSISAPWRDAVLRSLITLKAMTFASSGGLLAAATTSLPELIGGPRNWDYRFCWIRDATMTLYAMLNSGSFAEAGSFREWLLRAAAGHPEQMQIMYGLAGERRLTEIELPWLPGYENSKPVRIGNAAHDQLQLDMYGELMDTLHAARRSKLGAYDESWNLQCLLLKNLEKLWREPDEGIWEVRGGRQHFTYSKVMAWVAFDRGIQAVERFGLPGPVERWREAREAIHREVIEKGYDAKLNSFVQSYGCRELDASLLLIAEAGFVDADDPRFRGTVEAIERDLMENGFLRRYRPERTGDGVIGGEGTFLVCSFWLVNALVLLKRYDDAAALFDRLLGVRNDLGLLAEQYDPRAERLLGNYPQAFSHVGLINAAHNLVQAGGPARQRSDQEEPPPSTREPTISRPPAGDAERPSRRGTRASPA